MADETKAREREKGRYAGTRTPGRERYERSGEEERGGTTLTRRGTTSPSYGIGGSPFTMMRRMMEDMDRLFDDFGLSRDVWRGGPESEQGLWAPQIETFRRGDKLVVRADLPGLKREDVNVEIQDDMLTISGERSEEHEEEGDEFYTSERSYGHFFRALPLPEGVDAQNVNAKFKDGVLEITVPAPKEETQSRGRRIDIQ